MTSAVNSPDLHGPQPHSLSRKLTLAQTTPPPILHVSCEMQLTSQLPDQVLGGNTGALVVGDVHVDSGHVMASQLVVVPANTTLAAPQTRYAIVGVLAASEADFRK